MALARLQQLLTQLEYVRTQRTATFEEWKCGESIIVLRIIAGRADVYTFDNELQRQLESYQ